ncbi:uncharacterized protein LOC116610712 [Nematostella vectensis]|uniref:uncharacterized protein LOC116610712 n=1 Tax=Nematostella vectensis TaxID=45351 RepID=UPI0020770465|nr:uncharacterized protein LOC116610712 [Nematostella vectensis]
MHLQLSIAVVVVLLATSCVGGKVGEYTTSAGHMKNLLKHAHLESHGFTRKDVMESRQVPGCKEPVDQVKSVYYKSVQCHKAAEVEKQLNRLMKGVFGKKTNTQVARKTSALGRGEICEVGMEVDFNSKTTCQPETPKRAEAKGTATSRLIIIIIFG